MNITLTSRDYSATISKLGAELKSFTAPQAEGSRETVWDSNPAFWSHSAPLLFPIIGNLKDGKYMVHKTEYSMDRHGFARDMEFECTQDEPDRATFTLQYSDETLKLYPHKFRLSVEYILCGPKLSIEFTVSNLNTESERPNSSEKKQTRAEAAAARQDLSMHFHLGAHPGFLCPFDGESEASLEDYYLKFEKSEKLSATIYDIEHSCFSSKVKKLFSSNSDTINLREDLFKDDAVFFRNLESRSVSLMSKCTGNGIKVDFPGFRSVAFWKIYDPEAQFLCIEPWNGCAVIDGEPSELSRRYDVEKLYMGQTKKYQMSIEILDGAKK